MSEPSPEAWKPSSMASLRAFEAAARLLNFTAAAAELGVTQSAVSHSIREIEARLSVGLFRRAGRSIELTDAGKLYAASVREGLTKLRAADVSVTNPARRSRILTVSVSPSFAAKWLGPRIGDFAARHPDLDLRISATAQHVDFTDDVDLAIRHGDGRWPSLACARLCAERWLPVAAPALSLTVKRPKDLLHAPLIHHRDDGAWRRWFDAAGVQAAKTVSRGLTFSEMSLAIDAAVAGQGVALARSSLAARDLMAGRLICPLTVMAPADFAYWIVRPKDRVRTRNIIRFTEWLRAEAVAEDEWFAAQGGDAK